MSLPVTDFEGTAEGAFEGHEVPFSSSTRLGMASWRWAFPPAIPRVRCRHTAAVAALPIAGCCCTKRCCGWTARCVNEGPHWTRTFAREQGDPRQTTPRTEWRQKKSCSNSSPRPSHKRRRTLASNLTRTILQRLRRFCEKTSARSLRFLSRFLPLSASLSSVSSPCLLAEV